MKQISRVKLVLVVICVLATGFAFVSPASGNSDPAEPTVNGWVIRWADDGWYQVQTESGTEVCQGDRSCDVKAENFDAGEYRVINLTSGHRYPLVTVPSSGSEPPSDNGSGGGSDNGSDDSAGVSPVSLRFKTLGVNDGYVKVIIHPVPSDIKVNVFRNGEYVTTLQNGDSVVNDDKGENGHTYRLVALRDKEEVARIEKQVSRDDGEGAAVARLTIPQGMKLAFSPKPGYKYSIYRKNSGGPVGYNEGTRLATGLTQNVFVDPEPVRGASYGIVGKNISGNLTPVLSVEPDYNDPQVNAAPQAFENGFFIFGEGLRLSPPAIRCDYDEKLPNTRYCEVSGPGQYTVTHLVSQKSWTVDVKGPSPATNGFVVVNGVRVAVTESNYGSLLVMKNDAEFEAVTGLKAPGSAGGGAAIGGGTMSGFAGFSAANVVASDPPTKKYFHYSVPLPVGVSPQEVSSNVGVVHVNQYADDGSVGREVGHWVDGNYYNPEQYDQLVADRLRNGAYYATKTGLVGYQMSPWGRAQSFLSKRAIDLLHWVLDTQVGPNRVRDTDGDGEDDSPFCSGGSGCHSGIVLNEQTDPDGDGLSVFGDDDNDGDLVDDWEDDDPFDPDCSSNCNSGQTGGTPSSGGSPSDTGDSDTNGLTQGQTAGQTGGTTTPDSTGCTNCSGGGDDTGDTGDTGGTADSGTATLH